MPSINNIHDKFFKTAFSTKDAPINKENFEATLLPHIEKDKQEETMSFAQQLIDEGIEQGIEKGIEKGAFIGSIQQLQEIIGLPIQSNEALSTQKIPQLKKLNTQLRQQLNQKLS